MLHRKAFVELTPTLTCGVGGVQEQGPVGSGSAAPRHSEHLPAHIEKPETVFEINYSVT